MKLFFAVSTVMMSPGLCSDKTAERSSTELTLLSSIRIIDPDKPVTFADEFSIVWKCKPAGWNKKPNNKENTTNTEKASKIFANDPAE